MNTLNLTIPLTIPQLAELIRTQFSAEERQQLAELVLHPAKDKKAKKDKKELPSVADDLREAFLELRQYQRGEIQLQNLDELLQELAEDEPHD